MKRFASVALCFFLSGANAKDKNADEVIMLQTSMLLPSMGEQAAIAAGDELQQVEVQSANASSETTSLVTQKRENTPVGELKKTLKKARRQLQKAEQDRKDLQAKIKENDVEIAASEKKLGSAQKKLWLDEQNEKESMENSINCENCLKRCVCINEKKSDEDCDSIKCDEEKAKEIASHAGQKGSGQGGDGNSGGVSEGDGSSGGAEDDDTSASGSGDDDSPAGGSGGDRNSASAHSPGSSESSGTSSGSPDETSGSSDFAGDSAASIGQEEDGDSEGKEAVATGNSGNSGNSGGGDNSDEDVLSDEEKSLSFRPVACFALIAPFFQLV